jgi:ectoine hydroxylase-related dioxygenase (phytanoyl-CoA dioxygenase family)
VQDLDLAQLVLLTTDGERPHRRTATDPAARCVTGERMTRAAVDADDYERQGFVIVRAIFSGARLSALRAAADEAVDQARRHADLADSRRLALTDARLGARALDLLDAIADETVFAISEAVQGCAMVGNLYSMNVDSRDQHWHRDELFLPPGLRWDIAAYRQERPFSQIQWNLPLADDDYLHVVPGSHRDVAPGPTEDALARSLSERRFLADMPGRLCVRLRAGDGIAYNSNLLHAVQRPEHQPVRRTLHWYWVRDGHADPYQPVIPDVSAIADRLHPRLRAAYARTAMDPRRSRYHLP